MGILELFGSSVEKRCWQGGKENNKKNALIKDVDTSKFIWLWENKLFKILRDEYIK